MKIKLFFFSWAKQGHTNTKTHSHTDIFYIIHTFTAGDCVVVDESPCCQHALSGSSVQQHFKPQPHKQQPVETNDVECCL